MRTDFTIINKVGDIGNQNGRYWKLVQIIQWGKRSPVLDIRTWTKAAGADGSVIDVPCKGISLERAEAQQLHDLLEKYLTDEAPEPNEK